MILTGKALLGIVVSHNLNSGFKSWSKVSTMLVSSPIQDMDKWQFYNIAQPPLYCIFLIILAALGPYP